MAEFGKLLRTFRERAVDPEHGRRLSQVRLGELIGDELDDLGVTGGAISFWESGKSTISHTDRDLLLAIIKVLVGWQGIKSLEEANQLLTAGDYRALNADETDEIDAGWVFAPAKPVPPTREWQRLRRFLPDSLYEAVERAPRGEIEVHCLPHLRQLLQTVATYVPRHLAIMLLEDPLPPHEQQFSGFLEGALLFADISGFTNLSETLRNKAGKEGAEEIVRVVNRYLDAMLGILFRHNGRLIKFGGDAMLCLFTDSEQDAMNAVWAAWDMKQKMASDFSEMEALQEIFTLDMKVGQHAGSLFAATAGNGQHMEYILTGTVVEHTAQAESAAQRGDIIISTEIYQQAAGNVEAEPLPDHPDLYRLLQVDRKPTAALANSWLELTEILANIEGDLWGIVARLEALAPYLPAGVLPHLVYDPAQREIDGQHRQITALFANFVGMSDVIQAYGPEDPAGIAAELNAYFSAMQDEADYYGGAINKVDLYDQGDKLMVTFGAPVAHERDARRAALAALAMQQALSNLSSPVAAGLLSQRIGLHSGTVFAGNVGSSANHRREYTVMGDTINLAARLMAAAEPGEIRISEALWSQIASEFAGEQQPPQPLKGISEPVATVRLTGLRKSLVRERAPRSLRSDLVGREAELDALMHHADELLFGAGLQLIAVTGAGGVGKTRLIREWQQKITEVTAAETPVTWLAGHGRSYGQRTHGIFIDLLQALAGIRPADAPHVRLQKVAAALAQSFVGQEDGWLEEYADKLAYLGHFLELDLTLRAGLPERVAQLAAEPLQLQTRLALCDLLAAAARRQPLILVLEDLHWADAASLELLRFVIDRLPDDAPVLFCLVFRLQRQHAMWQTWHDLERSYADFCRHLALAELRQQDGRMLLNNLLPSAQLPPEFEAVVLQATDGNPLYIEEVLHTLIEDETLQPIDGSWQITQPVDEIRVPDTLYQIIQSRIDDLDFSSPGARRVLWLAAVMGDSFTEEMLRDLFLATGREKTELLRHLRALRNADMLQRARVESGTGLRPGYRFRHGLVRQVAYENMLVQKRRDYHARVADWLEENYEAELALHYDDLAYHCDQGQQWGRAFRYHWLVGTRDARTYANESAASHLQRALVVAEAASPVDIDLGQVHLELGKVLVLQGNREEALTHLEQAHDIFGREGDERSNRMQAGVCYAIGRIYENWSGEENLETALAWRDRGLALLPQLPTAELTRLHALGGIVYLRQRDFDHCVSAAQETMSLAEASGSKADIALAHRLLSVAARHQSRPREAMAHSRQSVAILEELGDLIGLGRELANQGVFAFEMDDWETAGAAYEKAVETLERVGDRYRLAMAGCNLADFLAHRGEPEKGLPHGRRGLDLFSWMESQQGIVFARAVLASLHWRQGELAAARSELAQARELVETHEIALFRPMVGRWSAQVFLAEGNLVEAEAEIERLLALGDAALADEAEPVRRLQGELLAAQGKGMEAIEVLEATLTRVETERMRYQAGLTRLALARVLAGMSERIGEARSHAGDARAIFADLGAGLDLQEAENLLASLE